MDFCGNVYLIKGTKTFSIRCTYCDKDVNQWPTFMEHVLDIHHALEEDWIDQPTEAPREDCLVEEIKKENSELENEAQTFKSEAVCTDLLPENVEDCLGDEELNKNCPKNTSTGVSEMKSFDSSQQLNFNKLDNVTLGFIEAYARNRMLYDPNHSNHTLITVRRKAYQDMISYLRKQHNIVFKDGDILKCIYSLRQWYYNMQSRLNNGKMLNSLPKSQQIYIEKCNFLPSKLVKVKTPCEICGQVFFNKTTVQVHMYKKHQMGDLPHKCPDCDRGFEQKSSLLVHQQRNHIGKVHQCDYCGRRFAVLRDLLRHIRTHTGERPFVCELCGKTFLRKSGLSSHTTAVHTKTRAYKCTMCTKDFLKRSDLNNHVKAHLNIRDKICETCGKGFTNCHSLIRHRQIHSEIKKFNCKLCDAKFHQFVGLNAHMKRTHNIVKNKSSN